MTTPDCLPLSQVAGYYMVDLTTTYNQVAPVFLQKPEDTQAYQTCCRNLRRSLDIIRDRTELLLENIPVFDA